MHTRLLRRMLLLVLCCASVTGCALGRDRRDAPWDPKAGLALHDQIPNWEHAMGTVPNYRPQGF